MSDAKLAALQSRFDQFDVDHSGFIDSTELTDLLRALGFNPPQHRVECIIDEYDTDHNGNLSFGEFVEVWAMYCMEAETECKMIRKAFSFFDFVRPSPPCLSRPICHGPACTADRSHTARRRLGAPQLSGGACVCRTIACRSHTARCVPF